MSNVAYTIPNLIQGVSQQPDAQRDPSQGEIQINGMSSIAEGLRKRDSSRTVARVSETLFGDAFIHTIQRDAAEKYISVIRTSAIDVFDLEGDAKTVNVDAGSFDYLSDANRDASENVTNARNQIRAVTIADFTFILNTRQHFAHYRLSLISASLRCLIRFFQIGNSHSFLVPTHTFSQFQKSEFLIVNLHNLCKKATNDSQINKTIMKHHCC